MSARRAAKPRPIRRVEDPAAADLDVLGQENKRARLKYDTVAEFLADTRRANAADGIKRCPVCDYLAAHVADDVAEVTAHVYSHPDWGPEFLTGAIRNTVWLNDPATTPHGETIAASVQHDAALALAKHPWGRVRYHVERLLRDPRTRFADGRAPFVLLAMFHANHRNARIFFERFPVAAAHFPGAEFDRMRADDFPAPVTAS